MTECFRLHSSASFNLDHYIFAKTNSSHWLDAITSVLIKIEMVKNVTKWKYAKTQLIDEDTIKCMA